MFHLPVRKRWWRAAPWSGGWGETVQGWWRLTPDPPPERLLKISNFPQRAAGAVRTSEYHMEEKENIIHIIEKIGKKLIG